MKIEVENRLQSMIRCIEFNFRNMSIHLGNKIVEMKNEYYENREGINVANITYTYFIDKTF